MPKKIVKGFTLIELLVVVAIIGVLTSIGVVAYNGFVKSAQKKNCRNKFQQYSQIYAK